MFCEFGYFDNSANIGYEKPNLGFYRTLTETIGEYSSEILFIDDNYDNCVGVEKAGLQALYLKKGLCLSEEILTIIRKKLVVGFSAKKVPRAPHTLRHV